MTKRSLFLVCLAVLFLAASPSAQTPQGGAAQDPIPVDPVASVPAADGSRLRVYLDCGNGQASCFEQYLRDEINWVDFVRQPQDADVHLLSSGQGTGGGGRELILRFVGRGEFEGHDDDLRAITGVGDTENTRREVVLRTVQVGLLDYVAHQGLPEGLEFEVSADQGGPQIVSVPDDPWNLWVFSAGVDGAFDENERSSENQWELSFSGDRVTEEWKVALGAEISRTTETFLLQDREVEVKRSSSQIDGFVAKSYGPHWSGGLRGEYSTSTYSNTKREASLRPAVEFSIFPYEEYATRELRVQYNIGPEYAKYEQITLFDKSEETLWRHAVEANLDQRQPWGSIRANFDFSQYLHDSSFYRVSGGGFISWRITRGLSVNFNGSASKIRDQLNLPKIDASDEEVLLRIRELQSGYRVRFTFGVTYSFGSLFNNVVNPRFGGGGGGGFRGSGGGGGFF